MKSPDYYRGKEQTYLKHFFLERYLETVAFHIGYTHRDFVCVDCFSGPWRSIDEELADTSIRIALDRLNYVRAGLAARGRQQYQAKRYVEALRDFDAAIRLEPDNPMWYGSRGLAYSYSGQHERAIEDYTREIEMAPRASAMPYNNRGWAYVDLGQPEKALPDLTKAIGMSPDYQKAFENRAKAYIALKDWPSVIADRSAAIQINATAWDYEQRAAAKRATNDEPGAAEDSRRAKELHAPPQTPPKIPPKAQAAP
jgi:tetratricopeptide (TPR) repeat protein